MSYEALFGGHEKHLQRGERAIIPLVAQDQRATKIAFGYIRDYLTGSPLLASMVQEVLALEIALTNRLTISCFPSTLRSLRGWSIPVGVLDELAFFRMEGAADSDAEIQASIRRGMLSFPNPRLIKISTPYMKSGVLFEDFKIAFGQDDPDRLRYAAGWVRERFRAEGVYYKDTEMTKAEAYLEAQPLFAQGRIDLVDQAHLIRELKLLESRPRAGGRTLVDHPRGGHDDYANALALGAVVAIKGATTPLSVPQPRGPLYRPSPVRSLSDFNTWGRRP